MKRPTQVWLAGVEWTLCWCEILEEADNGVTTDIDRRIRIRTKGATEAYLKQTLVHEILHGACFSVGGHWPSEEEHAVRLLELPLTSLFTDKRNGPLVRWLQRENT